MPVAFTVRSVNVNQKLVLSANDSMPACPQVPSTWSAEFGSGHRCRIQHIVKATPKVYGIVQTLVVKHEAFQYAGLQRSNLQSRLVGPTCNV